MLVASSSSEQSKARRIAMFAERIARCCSPHRSLVYTTSTLALLALITLYHIRDWNVSKLTSAQQRSEYTRRAIDNISWRPDDVLLVAHRGCIGRFPENTLAAIAACSAEEGAHVAEIDLEITRDGHLVLLHDSSPDRTMNRAHWKSHIPVGNLTLKELQSSYWVVQNEYTGVLTNFRIPTFQQALGVARACGIHLYVDTKGRDYIEEPMVEALEQADALSCLWINFRVPPL
jgi:glycerophosphoryl diester phosphodiesterase